MLLNHTSEANDSRFFSPPDIPRNRPGIPMNVSAHLVRPSFNQSINQSINRSINQSINRSINQSINHWLSQSINQSINRSITHSINQSVVTQSVNQTNNQSINQTINQQIDRSINQSIKPSMHRIRLNKKKNLAEISRCLCFSFRSPALKRKQFTAIRQVSLWTRSQRKVLFLKF